MSRIAPLPAKKVAKALEKTVKNIKDIPAVLLV